LADGKQGVHQIPGCMVICAEEGVRVIFLQRRLYEILVGRVTQIDPVSVGRPGERLKGLAVTRDPRIHCWRRIRPGEKRNPFSSGLDQVFGSQIRRAPIVNSNQVVIAAPRISLKAPVQEDYRNARRVKCGHNPVIRLGPAWREFDRRKENTGHFFRDEMPA
jgi:hypothetical protein